MGSRRTIERRLQELYGIRLYTCDYSAIAEHNMSWIQILYET